MVPMADPQEFSRLPPPTSAGRVVFLASPHITETDFDLCEPILDAALHAALTTEQGFVIIKEFGGPDLSTLNNLSEQYGGAEIILEAAGSDAAVRAGLADLLSQMKEIFLGHLAKPGSGPRLGGDFAAFELRFIQWANATRAAVLFEDLEVESWIEYMKACIAQTRAMSTLQDTGLLGLADQQAYFRFTKEWITHSACSVRRRNDQTAIQALNQVLAGSVVAILFGTAHCGIASMLRSLGIEVAEPRSITHHNLPPAALVVSQLVAGEDLEESYIRLALLRELVVSGLYSLLLSSGERPPQADEVLARTIPIASRWNESECLGLAKAIHQDTWPEALESWLVTNASLDDQRYFGVA